jgi:ribosomal-protein-alanine N-acetyltransferase
MAVSGAVRPEDLRIETKRVVLRLGRDDDAQALLDYFLRNRDYHRPWEPRASEDFYTIAVQRMALARRRTEFTAGRSACLLMFDRDQDDGTIIGRVNFSEIVRGPMQGCFLGYAVDSTYEGRGYMAEALRAAIRWAFADLGLHRIQASYRPENERSGRLLQRLGFVREGFARNLLFIDGAWRDHIVTALCAPS